MVIGAIGKGLQFWGIAAREPLLEACVYSPAQHSLNSARNCLVVQGHRRTWVHVRCELSMLCSSCILPSSLAEHQITNHAFSHQPSRPP